MQARNFGVIEDYPAPHQAYRSGLGTFLECNGQHSHCVGGSRDDDQESHGRRESQRDQRQRRSSISVRPVNGNAAETAPSHSILEIARVLFS
eukprot:3934163-Rhodomonas_salina.4